MYLSISGMLKFNWQHLKNIFIYLATLGLSCNTQDLGSLLWHAGFFLVEAFELLVVACGIPDQELNLGPLHWTQWT